ncbi:hypothetical protein [Clostridium rectalis]|uniref:hypothetical protein n=1 Tax=Clostridium rectalis TaxID=2040295 RepID=UPI000F633DA6|nr:hypothetical protein [Clostridium rectalis]
MKLLKRLIIWSIVPLTLELSTLFYVDRYYLTNKGQCKIEKVEEMESEGIDKNVQVPIPQDAESVKLSYDGKYVSYKQGNNIIIINTFDGEEKKVEIPTRAETWYYTWLPDRHRMYIWEKFSEGSDYLKVCYYDRDKDDRAIITDNHYNEVKIPLANGKYKILDHVISTLNGVEYVKVQTNDERSNIYRLNVMSQMEKYKGYSKVGKIAVLSRDDVFIYEDLRYGRVRISERENSLRIPGTNNLCILGVDEEDNVYVGDVINERVNKVFYGSLKENESSWKEIKLNNSVKKENIHIMSDGKVYTNNEDEGIVKDIVSGKETKYKGKLVQYYNRGIGIINDGKFKKVKF